VEKTIYDFSVSLIIWSIFVIAVVIGVAIFLYRLMKKIKNPLQLNNLEDPIKKLAERCNGTYIERQYDKSQKAEIDFNGFKIIVDYHTNYISGTMYQQQFTRIITPFLAVDDFQFEFFRKDIISSIETFLELKILRLVTSNLIKHLL